MIKLAFRNPYAVLACVIALVVFGITSVMRMPVDIFPEINIPVVMCATFYQGFSPEEMDKAITSRIERAFTQASHLDHIEAKSYNGVSLIKVYFETGTDVGSAESELIALENNVLRKLPKGTNPSTFLRFDVSNAPVCQLLVHSDKRTEAQLYDISQFTIRQQLASIPGVAIWPSFGGKYRQITVKLNRDALQAYGLSPFDVVSHVNASNLILPGGNADIGTRNVTIKSNSEIPTVADIDQIPIKAGKDGALVRVGDIAKTEDGAAIQTNAVRVNGKRAVIVPVGRAAGGNTIKIVDGVRAMIPKLIGVPDDVKVDLVFDQSQYVREAIQSLIREGLIGGTLAGLFMWVVLGDGRATIGVVLAIPLSVIAALIGLGATGQSLNTMTLGGLALSIGTLVDNATVVLENTYRHMALGKNKSRAALDATSEVALPMLAVTFCILIVFMPLQYLSGVSRFLFVPIGETVAMAMVASYVIAMTLLPIFCGKFLRGGHGEGPKSLMAPVTHRVEAGLDALRDAYGRALEWALDHRKQTLMVAVLIFVSSLALVPVIGTEFFPRLDFGELALAVQAPPGSSLTYTETLVKRIEDRVHAVVPAEDLKMVSSNLGLPSGYNSIFSQNAGSDRAIIQLQFTEPSERKRSVWDLTRALRADLRRSVPEAKVAFHESGLVPGVLNNGQAVPIDVRVSAPKLDEEKDLANQVVAAIRSVPGTTDTQVHQNLDEPYLDVNIDRQKADLLGVQERDVVDDLVTSVSSNQFIDPSYWLDPKTGNDYFLVVQEPAKNFDTYRSLLEMPVGTGVLGNVAKLHSHTGPEELDQMNLRPVLDVETSVEGRDLGAVTRDLQARLAAIPLPKKSSLTIAGQADTMQKTFTGFALGLSLALILVYLVMLALFRSFLEPLVIIVGVVFALTGVFWGLLFGGSTLNVQSLLGIMMLVGIAVANSIVLVSFARDRLAEGLSPREAVLEAGRTRMRPILMTATATVLGLLPSALHTGMHAEANTPLAQAVIGGLVVATLTTLMIVPLLWTMVARRPETAERDHDGDGEPTQVLLTAS